MNLIIHTVRRNRFFAVSCLLGIVTKCPPLLQTAVNSSFSYHLLDESGWMFSPLFSVLLVLKRTFAEAQAFMFDANCHLEEHNIPSVR